MTLTSYPKGSKDHEITNSPAGDIRPQDDGDITDDFFHINLPVLPPERFRQKRIIAGIEPCPLLERYRILRARILKIMEEKHWTTLAVTSPRTSEEKTLTAINLAICISLNIDMQAILVDADLRHPRIHDIFSYNPTYGLSDYLLENASLSEIAIGVSDIMRLTILPGRDSLTNSTEILTSPRMRLLFRELNLSRSPKRLVIFDLPPLLDNADALSFLPFVDSLLLVIEDGKTTKKDLSRTTELLSDKPILGTVLNRVRS